MSTWRTTYVVEVYSKLKSLDGKADLHNLSQDFVELRFNHHAPIEVLTLNHKTQAVTDTIQQRIKLFDDDFSKELYRLILDTNALQVKALEKSAEEYALQNMVDDGGAETLPEVMSNVLEKHEDHLRGWYEFRKQKSFQTPFPLEEEYGSFSQLKEALSTDVGSDAGVKLSSEVLNDMFLNSDGNLQGLANESFPLDSVASFLLKGKPDGQEALSKSASSLSNLEAKIEDMRGLSGDLSSAEEVKSQVNEYVSSNYKDYIQDLMHLLQEQQDQVSRQKNLIRGYDDGVSHEMRIRLDCLGLDEELANDLRRCFQDHLQGKAWHTNLQDQLGVNKLIDNYSELELRSRQTMADNGMDNRFESFISQIEHLMEELIRPITDVLELSFRALQHLKECLTIAEAIQKALYELALNYKGSFLAVISVIVLMIGRSLKASLLGRFILLKQAPLAMLQGSLALFMVGGGLSILFNKGSGGTRFALSLFLKYSGLEAGAQQYVLEHTGIQVEELIHNIELGLGTILVATGLLLGLFSNLEIGGLKKSALVEHERANKKFSIAQAGVSGFFRSKSDKFKNESQDLPDSITLPSLLSKIGTSNHDEVVPMLDDSSEISDYCVSASRLEHLRKLEADPDLEITGEVVKGLIRPGDLGELHYRRQMVRVRRIEQQCLDAEKRSSGAEAKKWREQKEVELRIANSIPRGRTRFRRGGFMPTRDTGLASSEEVKKRLDELLKEQEEDFARWKANEQSRETG